MPIHWNWLYRVGWLYGPHSVWRVIMKSVTISVWWWKGGRHDRLSDLNCFWAANDPKHPDDLFARSQWRNGVFKNYNTLNLFYVGYGGNDNSTTRFRRYRGEYYGIADDKVKPLLKEYTDTPHLLVPNKWYEIRIRVEKGMTTYAVNGEELFRYTLTGNEGDGHFGLRLLQNHVLFTGFKVTSFWDCLYRI